MSVEGRCLWCLYWSLLLLLGANLIWLRAPVWKSIERGSLLDNMGAKMTIERWEGVKWREREIGIKWFVREKGRERERDTPTEWKRDSSHGGMRLDQCPVCHCTVVCELPLYMYGDQHISWSSAIIPTQLLAWGVVFSPAYCFSSYLL